LPGRLLPRSFFDADPEWVAPRLLGKLLVHKATADSEVMVGRILETEAYLGPHHEPPDPAAHAHRGPTPRNLVLFGHAGHAYVYSIYGLYFCMNVSCEAEGQAGCVLLRALQPVAGIEQMIRNRVIDYSGELTDRVARQLTSGPSRLCEALGVTRTSHNGIDLTNSTALLQVRDDGYAVPEALVTPRIGIKHAVDWPLRFVIPGLPCVSGPRSLSGKRIFIS
jgi:DNA-3-methyladenine glycosylase